MRWVRVGFVLAGLFITAVGFIPTAAGASTIKFGVSGLELCGSLPQYQCDLGPIREHFIDYANVCSDDDCYFVSAADWEKVAAGVTPTLATLDGEYKAAGQSFSGGLSAPDLWTYWKTSGIDGFYLRSETSIGKNSSAVENAVKAHRALIVEDMTTRPSFIGTTSFKAGAAIMIVDGYTPKGPLVVFQAKTMQMTWAQWDTQVRLVWALSVAKTPPQGTAPQPPTETTSSPTATLSLSSNNLTSAGGIVTLTYSSENATSCTLTSAPAIWTSATEPASCNGTYEYSVPAAATAQEWTFTFTASNAADQSAVSTQTLVEAAPAAPTPQFDNPSPNWSGYVIPSSSAPVTGVSGDWTVPTLNCSDTPSGDVAAWVGIGGEQWATGGTSGALLQTGIDSECVEGAQQNNAWWEEVPATPNDETTFRNFPVSPGDEIEASVFETTTGAWQTDVSDVNTGLTAAMITGDVWGVGETSSDEIEDQGSSANYHYYGAYTAEWIVEDPEESSADPGNPYLPFANFGSITFSNTKSSFTSWSLTPDEEWGIVQDGVTMAAPTSTSTDGFTVTYTGP